MAPILEALHAYPALAGNQDAWRFWVPFGFGPDGQIGAFLVKVLPDGSPGCDEVRG